MLLKGLAEEFPGDPSQIDLNEVVPYLERAIEYFVGEQIINEQEARMIFEQLRKATSVQELGMMLMEL